MILTPLLVVALAVGGGLLASGGPAAAAAQTLTPYTFCFDATGAPDFLAEIRESTDAWSTALQAGDVIEGCGSDVVFIEIHGDGSGGVTYNEFGEVIIDANSVFQYYLPRIIGHTLGHVFGLPDNYTGDCNILMSGGSAPTSCTNVHPSVSEAAQVDSLWGSLTRP